MHEKLALRSLKGKFIGDDLHRGHNGPLLIHPDLLGEQTPLVETLELLEPLLHALPRGLRLRPLLHFAAIRLSEAQVESAVSVRLLWGEFVKARILRS